MAAYAYRGLDRQGRAVAGKIDAHHPRLARTQLREKGIYPTEVFPDSFPSSGPSSGLFSGQGAQARVTADDLILITRQWATLVSAGIPVMEVLSTLTEQVETPGAKKVCGDLRDRIREGSSLAEALAHHPGVFSTLYCQMVRAGESSGTLDRMLVRLADHLEAQMQMRRQIVSAITYPALMLTLSLLILIFILAFVVPKVTAVFIEMNQSLPLPTRILLAVSGLLTRWGWALTLLAAGGLLLLKRGKKSVRYDRWILALPIAGKVARMSAIARCTQTLATLLAGGVPLLTALEIAQQVIGNRVIEEAFGVARTQIREGEGIAQPLKESGLFPPMAIQMIATGEKSGQLEAMLEKVSTSYNREVETVLTRATALLSPVLVLGMGAIVFFIVLAVLLPIFEISHQLR
jgi:general secretion pathway protein F